MRLLESYIKNFLLEKGQFKKGTELSGWLIGLDCTKEEFNQIFNNYPEKNQSKGKNIFNVGTFIFNKNENIISHIQKTLINDKINREGGEFRDDLPVFICIDQGDLLGANEKIGGNINLEWMVHDMWHRLVDFSGWYSDIREENNIIYSYGATTYAKDPFSKVYDLNHNDAISFLNHYNFTPGVGVRDDLPSLAAFCLMNRDIDYVDKNIFLSQMEDYNSFKSFYEELHRLSPTMWEDMLNVFRGKVVCLNMF